MRPTSIGLALVLSIFPVARSYAADGAPSWKRAGPEAPAFLGDDGGGVDTVTVCDTADRYRDWLKSEHPSGCQTFQHDLPAIIEVVVFDPVEDTIQDLSGPVGLPLVKVHIPSRAFVGYLQLLGVHPVIPQGASIHFKKTGNEHLRLYPTSDIEDKGEGLDLGDQVSVSVIKYDPTHDDQWDLYATVTDGKYAGKSGWMLAFGALDDQGKPADQFDMAVITKK